MKCVRDHGPCSVGAADVVWFDFFSEFDLLTGISVESIKPAEDECYTSLPAASKTQASIADS